jgi:predicted aspartyl protease
MPRHAYDATRTPPAPILPGRIGRPGQAPEVLVTFLVDTGADMTVVPEPVIRALRLPVVSQIRVRGFAGASRSARVYAAEVEIEGVRALAEVIGLGEDALMGRDLLSRWVVTLRGSQRVMDIAAPATA